jgi:hypothetical protein
MSRRPPPPEALESLRDIFRRSPPTTPRDFKGAGSEAGVTEPAARRAWFRGWLGIEPIERQLVRERAIAAQNAEVLKAERVVISLKTNAVLLQNEMRRLAPVVKALVGNLLGRLDDLGTLGAETAVRTLQRIAKVHRDVSSISVAAIELDRLVSGEATSIVGVKSMDDGPADLVAVKAEIEAANRAVRRAEAGAERLLAEVGDDGITSN